MEILCRHCGTWFFPGEETLDMIEGGYIDSDSCNICDECSDLIYLAEFDFEQFSDADPGL
jgi:hypothetical protein